MAGNSLFSPEVISTIGVIATALVSYFIAKHNSKKDILLTDRQLLSQEQQQLRAEMREEIKYLRDQIEARDRKYDELEGIVHILTEKNMVLESEVKIWKDKYSLLQDKYDLLELENSKLVDRITELEEEARRRKEK